MSVTIALEPPRQEGVIRLLDLSDAYAQSLYPAESNHLVDLSLLEKPSVSFLVARNGDAIVGCCALSRPAMARRKSSACSSIPRRGG